MPDRVNLPRIADVGSRIAVKYHQSLSSNLILKDKILTVSLPKPLLGIQTTYEIFKRESEGFEPEKNGRDQAVFRGVAPDLNTGLPALYKVRTAILETDFHAVPLL